ncbi:M13 family metallopeptidase [Mesoplasma corruscae]|uniref:Endopeptidase O n=1 Tax=Mesoplasma corruscae TaxID=216874 RepID=A0A2S5RHH6_9MOLU|nr:M13 family metallopeptidase [Mesoplasma corruscae]PPE06763.1 endopeptidase O [Mesoplasma corruscae]
MSKVRAQDDFFNYVNGEWISQTSLPKGYAWWGSFQILRKKSDDDIRSLIDELLAKNDLSLEEQQIVNLYRNFLNDESRNKFGIQPIMPMIEQIDKLDSKENLTEFFIAMEKKWRISFFGSFSISLDIKDSNTKVLYVGSMGLGMSDRDYYDPKNPRHKEVKSAYKKYIEKVAELSKVPFKTKNLFDLVYDVEDQIAKVKLPKEELRNPDNTYNLISLQELSDQYSFINWKGILELWGVNPDSDRKIIISQPKCVAKIQEIVNAMSLDDLKDFMKIDLLTSMTGSLSLDYYEASFEYGSVFSGVKDKRPREERAANFVNSVFGEVLSKEYVKRHFSPKSKDLVLKMVKDLFAVYKVRINQLDWMSEDTKQKAVEKLDSFKVKIGYPDKWEDYSKIQIRSFEEGGSLYENLRNIGDYFFEKEISEINDPVDKTKWGMYAQTVNAYYSPTANEICFPAAILQKPFFDEHQSLAANLGGIGAVIGHEVSHGFDDQGSRFDKDGNFKDWWQPKDHKIYKQITQKLVEQYNEYEFDGTHVNGKLTLGENIGDLSGVSAALDICREQAPEGFKEFFENFAKVFCQISTPEHRNTALLTNPHSPEICRINGTLVNIDEFHDTYQTKPGDKMYKPKAKRIKVW